MKLILLAATAFVAAPVLAQTSSQTGTSSPTTQTAPAGTPDQTMTPPPADQSATPAGQAAPATTPAPASDMAAPAGQTDTQAPMTTGDAGATPAGGYQPTTPAVTGGTPGSNIAPTFRPAPTPDQAYPAPAPKDSYPICKKGQYDGCKQASDGGHKTTHKAKRRTHR
ncbi:MULTISPECIES: hypothetical protein [unclassified Sphingomonas]|jgi:hypothetical protein|uniref:hypothetical protein n=1 Tax=unclassified Sphingomonas TaxID=196159 RepID=UPI000E106F18|nr:MULTISPECIES: hypothetical protein [unclassified Sphingomonas]AXJ96087.1 hypothetical protein DM480_11790 [Sphingomonas sp. FARSPH]